MAKFEAVVILISMLTKIHAAEDKETFSRLSGVRSLTGNPEHKGDGSIAGEASPFQGSHISNIVSVLAQMPDWRELCVDERSGFDNVTCLSGNCSIPCKTLHYVIENVSDNTSIIINGSIRLTKPVHVPFGDRLDGLAMSGPSGSQVDITCTNDETGLSFKGVKNLVLVNLTITGCSYTNDNTTHGYMPAVYIQDGENIRVQGLNITGSGGIGLLMNNTHGDILITNCSFEENIGRERNVEGGGVRIELHYGDHNSSYRIENCKFWNNSAVRHPCTMCDDCEQGGGLAISIENESRHNSVTITSCEFQHNNANWGGGLYIQYKGHPHDNVVQVSECKFQCNHAKVAGAGLCIGYYNYYGSAPIHNKMITNDSHFCSNSASFGGGTAIFATHGHYSSLEVSTIVFNNCTWEGNSAEFGSAVDIAPSIKDKSISGFLPSPLFTNCRFLSNKITNGTEKTTRQINSGVFLVTLFTVHFSGSVLFKGNFNTALYLATGTANFSADTSATFNQNRGINGGAVMLIGFSALVVNDNSNFYFLSNSAARLGGALFYYSYDQHDYIASDRCFIQYGGTTLIDDRNITFTFTGNRADSGGNAISTTTLFPCYFDCFGHYCNSSKHNRTDFIGDCITKNFSYNQSDSQAITTLGYNFTEVDPHLWVVPGKVTNFKVTLVDELHNPVKVVYKVSLLDDSNHNITLDDQYGYTSTNETRLLGHQGHNGTLLLETMSVRVVGVSIPISLLNCPPGFVLNDSECICSWMTRDYGYFGIEQCDPSNMIAYITQGHWAGYLQNNSSNQHFAQSCNPLYDANCELYVASPCPSAICRYELDKPESVLIHQYKLPNSASELEHFMCGEHYTGPLCNTCKKNNSVHFHSETFKCGKNTTCNLGFVFYSVSELLPITLLFVVLLTFNINLTSGVANGFVFFAQILAFLDVNLHGIIKFHHPLVVISSGYKILYGFFNLEFFTVVDNLSFCLWEGAGVLDVLAFKYVTTVFTLALVMLLVCTMKYCCCKVNCCGAIRREANHSMIHGITAYLIICYAQYTQITFFILTPFYISKKGGVISSMKFTLYGGVPYFGPEHIKYAIPACLVLVTFVLLPPILLVVYPLHYKLLALCGLAESRRITYYFPSRKFKPFFDSFQGCFKDNYRFFAGLYFVYRLLPPVVGLVHISTVQYYTLMEMFLILMLLLHAVCQPYAKRWHNVVDACMLADMALINGITIHNYMYNHDPTKEKVVEALSWFQAVLIYLPLVYIGLYTAARITISCIHRRHLDGSENSNSDTEDLDKMYYREHRNHNEDSD